MRECNDCKDRCDENQRADFRADIETSRASGIAEKLPGRLLSPGNEKTLRYVICARCATLTPAKRAILIQIKGRVLETRDQCVSD